MDCFQYTLMKIQEQNIMPFGVFQLKTGEFTVPLE